MRWNVSDKFEIERTMIKSGGFLIDKQGVSHGHGLAHHYKEAIKAVWPGFQWHKWSELLIKSFAENSEIGVMGPASSGKTYCEAAWGLVNFYIWPRNTSVLCSTTTVAGLELRILGAVKELHNKAKERRPHLPGKMIESKHMLAHSDAEAEAKDFRDGVIGIACRVGSTFVGLSNYVGLKNDRIILLADEASLMGRGFLDSLANLRKNPSFQLIASGNPKDRIDALGIICEPSAEIGGWEGLPYEEKTRTWKTRANRGLAIQLCGTDSPNYDYPKGLNPFRGIITPEMIDADLAYYGKDSLQFSMMNLGVLPRDGGTRRVVTVSLCEQHRAFDEAIWAQSDTLVRVLGLDPAYSGVGGDRCVLTDLTFGRDINGDLLIAFTEPQTIVPVLANRGKQAEEQIAEFVRLYAEQRRIRPDQLGFDSTGRGTLMSAFARLWSPSVIPIEFGGRPTDRPVSPNDPRPENEVYGKMVTALWYSTRLLIEGNQLRKLDRSVAEEGSGREWGINKDGKIDVEPKDKTKERMGRSPDLWDSFAVAVEVARKHGFSIASGGKVGIKVKKTPDWVTKQAQKYQKLIASHSLAA